MMRKWIRMRRECTYNRWFLTFGSEFATLDTTAASLTIVYGFTDIQSSIKLSNFAVTSSSHKRFLPLIPISSASLLHPFIPTQNPLPERPFTARVSQVVASTLCTTTSQSHNTTAPFHLHITPSLYLRKNTVDIRRLGASERRIHTHLDTAWRDKQTNHDALASTQHPSFQPTPPIPSRHSPLSPHLPPPSHPHAAIYSRPPHSSPPLVPPLVPSPLSHRPDAYSPSRLLWRT